MIYTSNYENYEKYNLTNGVSISGDRGRSASFKGEYYSLLAPKIDMWKTWHENNANLSEKENNDYYIEEYYKTVLCKLNVNDIVKIMYNKTLLCYEKPEEFCHRHIVAAWIYLLTNLNVCEKESKIKNDIYVRKLKKIIVLEDR